MVKTSKTELRDDFDRHGWMSPLNHDAIWAFWRELYPDMEGDLG
ncbi:MAG: hypothetical protein VW949_04745 [Paracoccaceae bacterium]